MKRYRVWTCKLVVEESDDKLLPMGCDLPPRQAAIAAVERLGFEVLSMFSGWGGNLTEVERQIVEERSGTDGFYLAGHGPSKRA